MNVKSIRNKLKISQKKFAEMYEIPLRTVESWEMGEREPTEYFLKLLHKDVDSRKLAPVSYVFEKYTDRGGSGEVAFFSTEENAVNIAKKEWSNLSMNDKEKYRKDPAPTFNVTLRVMMWDDVSQEWVDNPDQNPIMNIWDALE